MLSRPVSVEEMVRQFKAHEACSHIFKIDKFSLLRKYGVNECESSVFYIGGYKWKLILYPNGNENDNGKGYISLYLEIQEPSNYLRLTAVIFILNQYRRFRPKLDEGYRFFNALERRSGASRLISLDTFNNNNEGFLVEDCALFGVVMPGLRSASNKGGTAECFTLIEKPLKNRLTYTITNFSTVLNGHKHIYLSNEYDIEGRKWRIVFYPKGEEEGRKDNRISVFLRGGEYTDGTPKTKVYVKYKLQILDQIHDKYFELPADPYWFPIVNPSDNGFSKFMHMCSLRNPSKGFVVNDEFRLGVEIDVISRSRYC